MDYSISKGPVLAQEAELLAVGMLQGEKRLQGAVGAINDVMSGELARLMKAEKFEGEAGSVFLLRSVSGIEAKRLLVIGLGKKADMNAEVIRQAGAAVYQAANKLHVEMPVSVLMGAGGSGLAADQSARAVVEGFGLAAYAFDAYRSKKKPTAVTGLSLVSSDAKHVRSAKKGIEIGRLMAKGANAARDLVNTPGGDMYPEVLVNRAKEIAKGVGTIRVRVYDREELEKMGAGGILGVGKGSEHPPYMVHMVYKPKTKAKKKVALVGKAVTFDSGGLSLKPAQYMESMKCDMGGSAAVLGAFSVIAEMAPKAEVHGIFGAAENMPSGEAIRPGDVLTAMNGKTIEVLNTDAEGRLTLADTLSFAVKQKPDFIIDLATLTGAAVVALGEEISAIMSNDDKLSIQLMNAAEGAGENMWVMPLEKSYKKLLKSEIADIKNIGGRYGGSITAGLFLQEFVGDAKWAHIDIAGPAFAERPINAYLPKGATGHAVRTLLELLRSI